MDRVRDWERRFDVPVVVAALATVPLLIGEQNHPHGALRTALLAGDWLVWLIFAAEVVVMVSVAPSRARWLIEHPLEVAIVVLTLPLWSTVIQSIRLVRVLRLLRLLRLGPKLRKMLSLEGVRYAALLALLALVGGAEGFANAEKVSVGDGVYWATTTMTTVGYGDITPKTATGKALACTLMLVGIGFFALITGAIAQRFLAVEVEVTERAVENLESAEEDLLRELGEVTARLTAIETALRRQRSTAT